MILDRGYDKLYPSEKNTTIFFSIEVHDVLDINVLHMEYTVEVKINLEWFDSRITFKNLKPIHHENQLDKVFGGKDGRR